MARKFHITFLRDFFNSLVVYIKSYGRIELKNATIIDKYGFYIPNHPKLSFENLEFISEISFSKSFSL